MHLYLAVYNECGKNLPSKQLRHAKHGGIIIISILSMMVTGCADVPTDPDALTEYNNNHDPAEPTNRKIFAANRFIDNHVLKPVAQAYKDDLPLPVQESIHNFVGNLREPQIAVNDLLQGNFQRAGTTSERFLINTTFGVVGLFDVASGGGLTGHDADFGQTFGVWGIGSGPFVELPILGSSNVRDSVGTAVTYVTNPFGSVLGQPALVTDIGYAGTGLEAVDGRARALTATRILERDSLDYYATLRSAYKQQREKLIAEGKSPETKAPSPSQAAPELIQ